MSTMYDNITGRSPIATDDLGYIGTGKKASQILTEGTTDYNNLDNKPKINNIELKGNKTSSDLGLQPTIDSTHKLSPDNISFTTAQSNALTSGVTSDTVSQVATNTTNILTVADQSTQYNYSSISSMSGTSGFTSTFYFDKPIPTGTYRIICNNVRTDTSKQCQFQVVGANATTQYTNLAPTISTAAYTSNEFTTTFDLYGIKVYCNTPIEITNIAIIPKALYDKGFTTYQPYSIPPSELAANITAVNTMIYTVQQASTITLQLKNARTYIVYGFMQGIGNVFWTLETWNGYTLKNAYNGTNVTLPTGIEASFDTTTYILTITSTFNGNNTLTILGTSL